MAFKSCEKNLLSAAVRWTRFVKRPAISTLIASLMVAIFTFHFHRASWMATIVVVCRQSAALNFSDLAWSGNFRRALALEGRFCSYEPAGQ